jgi:hypothetical protein
MAPGVPSDHSTRIAIHAGVFIVLGGIQIVATALILLCAIRYKDTPCPGHLLRQPTAKTATGDGHLRKRARCLCAQAR